MNLHEACRILAGALGLAADDLSRHAESDTIGGFHFDETKRQWTVGSIWEVEGQLLYGLIRAWHPRRILEVGLGNGCTTAHVLAALNANGEGELVSLDPTPYGGTDTTPRPRWTFIREPGQDWLAAHPDEHFDLVIEDAMHDRAGTRDILVGAKATAPRLILAHDAAHPTVGRDVVAGMNDALGGATVLSIEPSDCGWGYWVNPTAYLVSTFPVPVLPEGTRVLYLPIIEPGRFHDVALANKRGLRDALTTYGIVRQMDYLALPRESLFREVMGHIEEFQPTLFLTQFHSAEHLTPADLANIRAKYPALRLVNWSGDSWNHSLVSEPMLDLARQYDLWTVAAPDVLPTYAERNIHAAYWQIAYEAPVGKLPDMPTYDVVFLANVINDERRELMDFLRTLDGVSVGIYGDWEHADGTCQYDFGAGEALYKNAKIAIADNVYPDQQNYVSNRPIQALVAGGALLLHQHVPKMVDLLGIERGTHYVEWDTFETLEKHIRSYLKKGNEPRRRKIVKAGQEYALAHHLYCHRAKQLFEELLPEVAR